MINDVLTILWKEWREVILTRRGLRGGLLSIAVVIFALGILMPLQVGSGWLTDPRQPLVWSWLPLFIAVSIVSDAFAGERERHTLETLLASRLPDQAILFGKIAMVVLYAWLLTTSSMLVGVVTINLASPAESFQFYPLGNFVTGLTLSFLGSLLMACIGVLVSLKAPTTRQAYQRMSLVVIALWFVPMLVVQFVPGDVQTRLFAFMSHINLAQLVWGILVVLFIADGIMLVVVRSRFKRARLIPE